MLGAGRYLLGATEIGLLIGLAWLGASSLRMRLLPGFSGAPACLVSTVLALSLLLWVAEALGTFGVWRPFPYLIGMGLVGVGLLTLTRGWRGRRGVEDVNLARRPPSSRDRTRGL